MRDAGFWTNVVLVLIVLHLVIGFGVLFYKIRPKKEDKNKPKKQEGEWPNL
jgi:hypothetical protein